MPSQEDLAHLAYAFSTLAKAPVAAYPESGAFLLAEQGQDVARAKLADEARKKAQRKAKKKGRVGRVLGMAGNVASLATGNPAFAMLGNTAAAFTGEGDMPDIAGAFMKDADASEGSAVMPTLFGKRKRRGAAGGTVYEGEGEVM